MPFRAKEIELGNKGGSYCDQAKRLYAHHAGGRGIREDNQEVAGRTEREAGVYLQTGKGVVSKDEREGVGICRRRNSSSVLHNLKLIRL